MLQPLDNGAKGLGRGELRAGVVSPVAFSCAFTLSSAPFLSDYTFAGEQGELKSAGR